MARSADGTVLVNGLMVQGRDRCGAEPLKLVRKLIADPGAGASSSALQRLFPSITAVKER
jgi:hypothetical protein